MITNTFIIITGLINLTLCFLLLSKEYTKRILFYVFTAGLILPLASFCGNLLFGMPFHQYTLILIRLYIALSIIVSLVIAELCTNLLRESSAIPDIHLKRRTIPTVWVFRLIGLWALLFCFLSQWVKPAWVNNSYIFVLNSFGVIIFCSYFLITVYILYLLENIYRYAEQYQKRIIRLFLLSLSVIMIFQLLFLMRSILYKTITQAYSDTLIITYGICFPVYLYSLFRFRLSAEKITITRGTIHASFTLFSVGAISLGLGAAVLLARHFGLTFSYFGLFLFLFSVIFFTLLIAGSPDMRKRVTRAVNTRIYKSKYDYQQQFFRLHRTYLSGSDLLHSINALIENMKDTLTVKNVYIFISDNEDGNFLMHKNPDDLSGREFLIKGDSPLAACFEDDKTPLDFTLNRKNYREQGVLERGKELFDSLDISMVFPILHDEAVYGFLMFKRTKEVSFDNEDTNIINAFSLSIGDVFYKFRILQEQIEYKQFESFNHVASFIIHDIKNQVATLSLLTNNAKKNINNPDFQKSLLRSLNSCAGNLQNLVDKFTAPPKESTISIKEENINNIIQDVINNIGVRTLDNLQFKLQLNADILVPVDRNSFFYVIMNLITNAIESMDSKGILTMATDNISHEQKGMVNEMDISEHLISGKRIIVTVKDTGKGMSQEFLNKKLFHPFTSTKDKGIGVGLYQCKTLIEKMNGKIICKSQFNKGTTFYILL